MRHFVIMLPFPPSTNGLYAGKARRFKSKAYKTWIEEAGYMANTQDCQYFYDRVDITFHLNNNIDSSDCSNYIKAAEDFLVMRGIIKDDCKKYVRSTKSIWSDEVSNGCMIEIQECE